MGLYSNTFLIVFSPLIRKGLTSQSLDYTGKLVYVSKSAANISVL